MAISNGWDGAIFVGSTSASSAVLHMNSWTMNITGDALEKTAFGEDDRTYDPGLRSAVVDFAGYYEYDNTLNYMVDRVKGSGTNSEVAVYCYWQNGTTKKGWRGKGPITAMTVGGAVDGLVPVSGSVQISGGMSTV